MKICIKKYEKKPETDFVFYKSFFSVDGVKPYDIEDEEWCVIEPFVDKLRRGEGKNYRDINTSEHWFDLFPIEDEKEGGILAESEHFFIVRDYEDASIYEKPDAKRITCVGHFYGDPTDAYIDPDERFCITIGCGIIKYNLQEPYEEYMYDRDTPQWAEVGREGDDIEWCDRIETVTDSYVEVSIEGEDRRRFNLSTLEKEEIVDFAGSSEADIEN